MITETEYAQLVRDCLELLRKLNQGSIAGQLESIINKPIIEESGESEKASKHISEATERPRTSKEQLQAIIEFLEAHLYHSAKSVSRLAEMTRHDSGSIKWMGGEDAEGRGFTGESLSVDPQVLAEIETHLQILRQAAEMHAELN